MINKIIKIEIIYISTLYNPQYKSIHIGLYMPYKSTVLDALKKAKLTSMYYDKNFSIGIFSNCVSHETVLMNGDRIEIYHCLFLHPRKNRIRKIKNKLQLKNI